VCSPSSPCGRGTASSFYRPRGGSLQSCCTVPITCGGMVYSVVELMAVPANLIPTGCRGESCSCPGAASRVAVWGLLIRPYAGSRVRLTGGRKVHSSRRGGVLSSRTPTASVMMLQCPGWRRGSGGGRTGPMVTKETCLTGPTSWRRPGRARDRHPSPFLGLRHPLSRVRCVGRTRVGSTVSWS
jgi:hypothetical protein